MALLTPIVMVMRGFTFQLLFCRCRLMSCIGVFMFEGLVGESIVAICEL